MLSNIKDVLRKLSKSGKSAGNKKTVLFAALDSVGHINSQVSVANHLKFLGYRTVFVFFEPIQNNLKESGHEVYDCTTTDLVQSKESDAAQDKWNEVVKLCQPLWQCGDVMKNYEEEFKLGLATMVEDVKKYNANLEKKLELIKPDVIVIDHYFGIPALFKLNLPWIRIYSASPLSLHCQPDLAPGWLGLPTKWDQNDPKQVDWVNRSYQVRKELYDKYNAYWTSFGLPNLPLEPLEYIPRSPILNIYMYPEEIDYQEYPLSGWERCDCMVRDQKATKFDIPEKLRNKPGKLIFLSLGSLASADVILMKRLTSMLADSPHRFIVSKGPLHDQYELPDNMWGEKFVPQLQVLTVIDLIITHGGNNTLTESFFYGVPGYIICPLFGDQFDNAQRMQEKGLGIRLDPYNCSKEELFNAIETMLNKDDVKSRAKQISERMQKPEARGKAVTLVIDCVKKIC